MTGHTKEPWCESISSAGTVEIYASGNLIAEINADDDGAVNDARRIVACVNALATIPDPSAYVAAMGECVKALEQIKARADELRAGTGDWFELVEFGLCAGTALQSARAAMGEAA